MTYKYTYKNDEVTLECELDYTPEELGYLEDGLQMVPDSPAEMTLTSAKANGMEMYEVLAEWVITEIEEQALEQLGEAYA
jgi:hypothetical protein